MFQVAQFFSGDTDSQIVQNVCAKLTKKATWSCYFNCIYEIG